MHIEWVYFTVYAFAEVDSDNYQQPNVQVECHSQVSKQLALFTPRNLCSLSHV